MAMSLRYGAPGPGSTPILQLGNRGLLRSEAASVAVLGWQEATGQPQLWDVTILGSSEPLDLVTGLPDYQAAEVLAEQLSSVMCLPLVESSAVGGSQSRGNNGAALGGSTRRCCVG